MLTPPQSFSRQSKTADAATSVDPTVLLADWVFTTERKRSSSFQQVLFRFSWYLSFRYRLACSRDPSDAIVAEVVIEDPQRPPCVAEAEAEYRGRRVAEVTRHADNEARTNAVLHNSTRPKPIEQ